VVAAPYTPEMLLEAAELAGYAIVLSREGGRAKLRFTRLLKGRPRVHGLLGKLGLYRVATVAYRSQPERPLLGDWWDEGAFIPGNQILTHLTWSDRQECYEAVWWNATSVISGPD
jgi:hypothetical protein